LDQSAVDIVETAKRTGARDRRDRSRCQRGSNDSALIAVRMRTKSQWNSSKLGPISACWTLSVRPPKTVDELKKLNLPAGVDILLSLSLICKDYWEKKIGMARIFNDQGHQVPVTVIACGPCTVLQRKIKDHEGYDAVQLAFGDTTEQRMTKAAFGACKKLNVKPLRHRCEMAVEAGDEF